MKSNIAIAIHVQKNFIDDKEKLGVKREENFEEKIRKKYIIKRKNQKLEKSFGDTG